MKAREINDSIIFYKLIFIPLTKKLFKWFKEIFTSYREEEWMNKPWDD